MNITELINSLQSTKDKLGDIEVTIEINGSNGYESYIVKRFDETILHRYDLAEQDDKIRLFPDSLVDTVTVGRISGGGKVY